MPTLNEAQVATRLGELKTWTHDGNAIRNIYEFPDFVGSLTFVNKVGELAEAANHHPDIDIRYNKVILVLSTHSAGGLTTKDFDLATQIEELVA
jgi:4a-hydroxytetrahydrobiopterin dehydratase